MTEQEWKALAAHFKAEHPDAYFQVTGEPVWLDYGSPAERSARGKWLRYVKKNVVAA